MRAVAFDDHGSVDNLEIQEVSTPDCGDDEVLIDIKATALNHLDLFVVRELDHYVSQYPFWSGSDMAGHVASVGSTVDSVTVGDRVLVLPFITCGECVYCHNGDEHLCRNHVTLGEQARGGLAEYIAVPEDNVVSIPDHVDLETAASVPIAGSTAWGAFSRRGSLKPYEDVLIVGATGGVGTFAVQIAKDVFNVETLYGTTSTDKKAEFLRDLGVDHVIDYTEESFDRRIWELTDKTGVDVVYNSVGGETWVPSMRALKNGGRLITSGATAGPNPETEIRLIFVRQIDILGSSGDWRRGIDRLLEYVWDGTIDPVIDAEVPFAEYERAYERMQNRNLLGKVVITQQ
jgi:NADPH:quinone reductase-like Zn-dependent oxidoreductase